MEINIESNDKSMYNLCRTCLIQATELVDSTVEIECENSESTQISTILENIFQFKVKCFMLFLFIYFKTSPVLIFIVYSIYVDG